MSFEIRELSEQPQRALLVGIGVPGDEKREREALLAELEDLVSNLGIGIAESRVIWTRELQAKYLCGIGKAEEIRELAENLKADALIIDNLLSPSQQREWEKLTELPVKDREEVILDVFASRARTREATMQVDLARMQYALPRMVGMWKHLDRQRGGSGGGKGGGAAARGEGEKQIEVDRRLAHERIEAIRAELDTVRRQRATQRKERMRRMRGSRVCSTLSRMRESWRKTSCLLPWIRQAARSNCRMDSRWYSRIRSDSYGTCRIGWWRRSSPRWKRLCWQIA